MLMLFLGSGITELFLRSDNPTKKGHVIIGKNDKLTFIFLLNCHLF